MSVFAVFFLGVLGFVLICGFMLWLTNRVAQSAITRYFRDAEYILEHHQPPQSWQRAGRRGEITDRHLTQLDKLMRYFETSPFVADEETRSLLLDSLGAERSAWQAALGNVV
ncbi:MAG: hypothetical protein AAF633_12200 [Chloroflexota bacterium]